LLSVMQL